jgi:hypothetical protein
MKDEILNFLTNQKHSNHITVCGIDKIFANLKNRSGGRKALIRNADKLVQEGLLEKPVYQNGATTYRAK